MSSKYNSGSRLSCASWGVVSRFLGYDRIHEFNGRLGNQMFQYALAFAVQQRCPVRVGVDIRRYGQNPHHNGWEINRIFNMPDKFPELSSVRGQLAYRSAKIIGRVTRELDELSYKPRVLESALSGYIRGYWPSYKYSEAAEDILRKNFTFAQSLGEASRYTDEISHPNSVGIHVRRGDYLSPANASHFNGICTNSYYEAAFRKVFASIKSPKIFIFSDDIDWCKQTFSNKSFTYVEGNKGRDSWRDMALFSKCSHHVIANSSFSWWGMWLSGRRPDHLRIGPSRLLNPGRFIYNIDDFLDPGVIKIDSQGRQI